MFSFNKIITAAIAACAVPVLAQTTPAQVVQNINMLTQKSQALQAPAQSITIINGPLIVVGQGPFPEIIRGFTDIVSTGVTALSQMQGMKPVAKGAQSDAIFDAFRQFVRVHQQLLSILIGKAGLFETVPFIGGPVAAVLRQIENLVDSLAFALIDTVQSRATDIQASADSLEMTVGNAIQAYEGVQLQKRESTPISRVKRGLVVAAAA